MGERRGVTQGAKLCAGTMAQALDEACAAVRRGCAIGGLRVLATSADDSAIELVVEAGGRTLLVVIEPMHDEVPSDQYPVLPRGLGLYAGEDDAPSPRMMPLGHGFISVAHIDD